MKIVILDWNTVSSSGKNELLTDRFKKYGDVTVYGLSKPEEAIERIGNAEIVLCNKTPITRKVFENCPNIKYIGLFATGFNNVDIDAANDFGVTVSNSPEYSTLAVAQHTFALILHFYSKIEDYSNSVNVGDWFKSRTFSYFTYPMRELAYKNISIIGFGHIGKKVAEIAKDFEMNVYVNTRTVRHDEKYNFVHFVDTKTAFEKADILTVHCPLTPQTKGLINKENLSLMKNTALVINTARGDIVCEKDLAEALNSGKIMGAGLDVLSKEPMIDTCPLRGAKNCVITPHVAWAARETRDRLLNIVENNLKSFIGGKPVNVVNNNI